MLFLSVILAFLTLGALWFAAVLNEHDMHPMRRLAELMKRPALEVALVALVAVGLIHHGATKGTNGVHGAGGEMGGTKGVQNVGGVENVKWKMENVKLGDAPMIVPGSTETGILHFTLYTLHSSRDHGGMKFIMR